MPTPSWLRGLKSRLTGHTSRPRPRRPFAIETLEDRSVPAFGFGSAFGFGGSLRDVGTSLVRDSVGNLYVSGVYRATVDFDPNGTNPGSTHVLTATGADGDSFAAKYLADGTFQWATDLGAGNALELATDGSGVYVPCNGPVGGTVSRLDAATGAVTWTTTIAPSLDGGACQVVIGPSGGVYADARSTNTWSSQAVVTRLDPATGNALWTRMSTGGGGFAIRLAVDGAENLYAAGFFAGTTTFGTTTLTSMSSAENSFVWKLNSSGDTAWAGRLGSTGGCRPWGITADAGGNAYLTGQWYNGTNDFDPGSGTVGLTNRGGLDIYVVKLIPGAGGAMQLGWARGIGGTGTDIGYAVAADAAGNVYTTGQFTGTVNFNPTSTLKKDQRNLSGGGVFVSKLNSAGNYVDAAGLAGTPSGTGSGVGRSIKLDSSNNVYLTGTFGGTADFDPTSGTYNLTSNGDNDAFVVKLTQSGSFAAAGAPETKPLTWAVAVEPPRSVTPLLAPAADGFAPSQAIKPQPVAVGVMYLPPSDPADDFAPIRVGTHPQGM